MVRLGPLFDYFLGAVPEESSSPPASYRSEGQTPSQSLSSEKTENPMNLDAVASLSALKDVQEPRMVLMAAKAMNQAKVQGANAVALIERSAAPPPDGVRGRLLNVMA